MEYVPHEPHPKQAQFLELSGMEALYGGAAGGGKSDALLMAALAYVDVPGYSALILRRTYADLAKPEALIPRSKEWLYPTDAKWNEQQKQWTFPSGATLSFGYLEHEDDKYHYQGAAYQFIGWDELTQFTETQYTYLFSRCRRPSDESLLDLANVPLRIRAASNPGGIGHDWVKERFAIDAEGGHNEERPFVPARLEDNPSLDAVSYDVVLAALDIVTRAQLRYGDWDIGVAGNVFQRAWWRRYHPMTLPVGAQGATFVDTAGFDDKVTGDYCTIATVVTAGLDFYWTRLVRDHLKFPDLVDACMDAYNANSFPLVIEDVPWAKPLIQTLSGLVPGVIPFKIEGRSKLARAQAASPYVEAGNCYLPMAEAWVGDFIEEHAAFPNGSHDDMVDTTSMAMLWLPLRYAVMPGKNTGHVFEMHRNQSQQRRPVSVMGGRA